MLQSVKDYSLFFFCIFLPCCRAIMKTPVKISMKVLGIVGALSRMSIQNVNHLQVYFCGIRPSLIFFDRGAWRHVSNTRTCTQKMSYFHVFPEKDRLLLSTQGKISCFRKKIPSFQIMQERSCAGAAPFGKTIFSEGLKKISYFRVFFKKDHLSFSV